MKKIFKKSFPILLSSTILACSSSSDPDVVTAITPDVVADTPIAIVVADTPIPDASTPVTMKSVDKDKVIPAITVDPLIPVLTLSFTATKAFHFEWTAVPGATSYELHENITSSSGYKLINTTTVTDTTTATSFDHDHVVPLYARLNAKYILKRCVADDCTKVSAEVFTMPSVRTDMTSSIGYFKAGNTGAGDGFGSSVSLSADGNTLAVGAITEDSNSTTINVIGEDDSPIVNTGAVYVFIRNNSSAMWSQQAYLKASNAVAENQFGISVSLSADGNTLVVGAAYEDGTEENSGAAYVFTRSGTDWMQRKYLKANTIGANDYFGISVSLNADGNTLAVGASRESSNATGIDMAGTGAGVAANAGAVYVFIRDDEDWSPQAYLKASNTGANDFFGISVSLNANGNTLAVGAYGEGSDSTTIGEKGDDDGSHGSAGAVYVFARTVEEGGNIVWTEEEYLKARNADEDDLFGGSVSISKDGNTLAVGALGEDSSAMGGVNDEHDNTGSLSSGAAYVFTRTGAGMSAAWSQQAFLKASNTSPSDNFGHRVSVSADGNTLAVSSYLEGSDATGINGVKTNTLAANSGAVYTYTRSADTSWSQQAYIKARYTNEQDRFGYSVVLSADGDTLAVGASEEDGNTTGVNTDQTDGSKGNSGAVYVY